MKTTGLVVRVDRTWSGERLAPRHHAELRLTVAGGDLLLTVDAPFHGDPPPPGPPGPTPALWEHEVVELFVVGDGERYTEIELSPHGHHLVLRLAGVRREVENGLPLDFRAFLDGRRWRGEATVPRAWLPPPPHRANAYRVHALGAGRRHLAATPVPGAAPDFHRPALFPQVTLPFLPGG